MRFTMSLGNVPIIDFQTVPMFVWLRKAIPRPLKEDCRAIFLLLSSPPGDRWCDERARSYSCVELLNTPDIPRRKPLEMDAFSPV